MRAGLAAIDPDTEIVVVHDAARALATPALFELVIDTVRAGADAAVPAIPVADTLKRVDGDRVVDDDRPHRARRSADTAGVPRSTLLRDAHTPRAATRPTTRHSSKPPAVPWSSWPVIPAT